MKAVIQEDATGCGIASVATLAGLGYQQVRKEAMNLGISVTDSRLWSDTAFIRTLLKHFHIKAHSKERPFQSWEMLPPCDARHKMEPKYGTCFLALGDLLAKSKGPVVLDSKGSLKNNVRTDFGRIKPKWFLTVTLPQSKTIN